jgi:hypothetical protein
MGMGDVGYHCNPTSPLKHRSFGLLWFLRFRQNLFPCCVSFRVFVLALTKGGSDDGGKETAENNKVTGNAIRNNTICVT